MRKLITLLLALTLVVGTGASVFQENMNYNEDANAAVDRPMINHVKAFLNNYLPPVYNLLF